jgi:hypothetical protein
MRREILPTFYIVPCIRADQQEDRGHAGGSVAAFRALQSSAAAQVAAHHASHGRWRDRSALVARGIGGASFEVVRNRHSSFLSGAVSIATGKRPDRT